MVKEYTLVPFKKIVFDPLQPRKKENRKNTKDLEKDISQNGLYYDVIVTPYYKKGDKEFYGNDALKHKDYKYYLMDGERRVRAMKKLGQKEIPVQIRIVVSELELREIQLTANYKRMDISVEEMADAVERIEKLYYKENPDGDLYKYLSEKTGKSMSYFTDAVKAVNDGKRDLDDGEKLKKFVDEGRYSGYGFSENRKIKDPDIRQGVASGIVKILEENKDKKNPIGPNVQREVMEDLSEVDLQRLKPNEKREMGKEWITNYYYRKDKTKLKKYNFNLIVNYLKTVRREMKSWDLSKASEREKDTIMALEQAIIDTTREKFRLETGSVGGKRHKR